MSKTKAKSVTGEEMFNQSRGIDSSIDDNTDPLPWLIHSLREKQADQSQPTPSIPTTEPQKDSP